MPPVPHELSANSRLISAGSFGAGSAVKGAVEGINNIVIPAQAGTQSPSHNNQYRSRRSARGGKKYCKIGIFYIIRHGKYVIIVKVVGLSGMLYIRAEGVGTFPPNPASSVFFVKKRIGNIV